MKIILRDMDGAKLAEGKIFEDRHGYLYISERASAFDFELDVALYGYQEGRISSDTIDDDNGMPYIQWEVIEHEHPEHNGTFY